VAIPAIQAISYSMDRKELREMYANLLAKAMTTSEKDKVHPGFVEVIKQMSPLDAENLRFIHSSVPITTIVYDLFPRGFSKICEHVFLANPSQRDIVSQAMSLSSLQHLGLVTLTYDSWLAEENLYEIFDDLKDFELAKQKVPSPEVIATYKSPADDLKIKGVSIKKGLCSLAPFGNAFQKICID
jgi:hypothetical protein